MLKATFYHPSNAQMKRNLGSGRFKSLYVSHLVQYMIPYYISLWYLIKEA